jgi:hypothetical protein
MGGSCVVWRIRVRTKVIHYKGCDRLEEVRVEIIEKKYCGPNPFWSEHHWLGFTLPNGFKFYADDDTLGGDDHIFFDFDDEIFPDEYPPRIGPYEGLPGLPGSFGGYQ